MKTLLASAAALALLGVASTAAAQTGPVQTGNGQAKATIVTPISITPGGAAGPAVLDFGSIASRSTASVVTIDALTSAVGDASDVHISGGSAAAFAISGAPSLAYIASVPLTVTLDDAGAGAPMVATLSSPNTGLQALSAAGTGALNVGGSLAVGANQLAGDYSGTFSVTVQYQ